MIQIRLYSISVIDETLIYFLFSVSSVRQRHTSIMYLPVHGLEVACNEEALWHPIDIAALDGHLHGIPIKKLEEHVQLDASGVITSRRCVNR